MQRSDFTYSYTHKGYMIQFKGKNIGGAGTLPSSKPKHWQHKIADLKMYRKDAEREIERLVKGQGQARFRQVITEIEGGFCLKCGQSFFNHNDDGSCVLD